MQTTVKLLGYAPDADPTTPGIFTTCAQIIPTQKGFKAAPSPVATDLPALAAACLGAAVVRKLDNSTRLIAATATALYEDASTSWTTQTRSVGGAYSAAVDTRWSFAQFNDVTLAVNKADTLQASSTGAFANVTGAPKASIVETVNEFVFLFDTNEGIYGDSTNRWWCAGQGNYTDWTPAISTNCYTGTLTSTSGKIRAGKRFGDNIIAYKDRAMYLGYFAGSPTGWKFTEIPGETGALSNEVVVNVGEADNPVHIFMGYNDFYRFDGARATPIGDSYVRELVYSELKRSYSNCCISLHDRTSSTIRFYYPTANQTPDKCVVYNYQTGAWGRDDRTIEAAVEYVRSSTTYTALGTYYATYDDLPSASYDTAFGFFGNATPAIFDSTHTLKTLTGAATSSSITTGDMGNDTSFSLLSRVKPRFITAPTSASLTNYYRSNLSDSITMDTTTTMSSTRFDLLRESRWHKLKIDFTGDMEVMGITIDTTKGGDE